MVSTPHQRTGTLKVFYEVYVNIVGAESCYVVLAEATVAICQALEPHSKRQCGQSDVQREKH